MVPTCELRFVRRDFGHLREHSILQQRWVGRPGEGEWRDVPLLEEGEPKQAVLPKPPNDAI